MFTLKPGRLPPADVKNIIFFVRPKLELMDIITDNVLRYRGQRPLSGGDRCGPNHRVVCYTCAGNEARSANTKLWPKPWAGGFHLGFDAEGAFLPART